jgi:hypothetical protein
MVSSDYLRAVLDRIAVREQVDPKCVSLGDKGAVFYRSGDELLCLCQKGSQFWYDAEAEVLTALAIRLAARP